MRLALLTDIHYGVRNDSPAFLDAHAKFFKNTFFPYLKQNDIKTVICLGDLLDRRKFINYYTAKRLREDFLIPLGDIVNEMYWILGNHDIFYKQSFDIKASTELGLQRFNYLNIIDKPENFCFDGLQVLMVPWITDENRDECLTHIKSGGASICMGHFEIQGFDMFKGVPSHVGEDKDLFRNFRCVYSGHFHHKHNRGNIHFLGSVGDYTWAEYGSDHGFHVLDTETENLEFIANPYSMHAKIYYDDSGEFSVIPPGGFDYLNGKIVKIVVVNQTNPDMYEWYLSQLEAAKPLDYKTTYEVMVANNLGQINSASISEKDTLTVIRDVIAMTNTSINSTKLDQLMIQLYQAATENE